MNEDIKKLQISNPHIIRFYQEHPQLDFESINLIVVDVLRRNVECADLIFVIFLYLHSW